MLFFVFFNRVAASTLTRPTTSGTRLTTVFNALFLIAFPYNGATTDRTQLLCHLCPPFASFLISFICTRNHFDLPLNFNKLTTLLYVTFVSIIDYTALTLTLKLSILHTLL
jgi:hypothetical protein